MSGNHIKQMSLESLNSLDDGRVSMAFLHELKRAVADCMDRPGDKTAREVSLVFKLKPIIDESTGQCDMVNGDFKIKSKVPERKSKTYNFGVRKGGQLVFNENSPQAVDQKTIFDGDEDE